MNALSTHRRPLRRSSRKSSQHRRNDALSSRFRRLVGECLEDRFLLTLGVGEVGQVANEVGQAADEVGQVANPVGKVANLPNDAITPAAPQAVELFNISPALFVENVGQWSDPAVRYAFQGSGANVLQTQTGPVIQLFQRDPAQGPDKVGPPLPAGTHNVGPALPAGTAGPTGLPSGPRQPSPSSVTPRRRAASVTGPLSDDPNAPKGRRSIARDVSPCYAVRESVPVVRSGDIGA
jgi:hypothetical protein